jgi:hypothetical protein
LLEVANAGFCKEGKCIEAWKERMLLCVSYIKSLKKSINWIVSKTAETTDI